MEFGSDEARKKAWAAVKEKAARTKFVKTAIIKLMEMHPRRLAVYEPESGLEMIIKTMIEQHRNRDGVNATAVLKELKEALGERIGSRWKETKEHGESKASIINDIPSPKREPELPN